MSGSVNVAFNASVTSIGNLGAAYTERNMMLYANSTAASAACGVSGSFYNSPTATANILPWFTIVRPSQLTVQLRPASEDRDCSWVVAASFFLLLEAEA